MTEETNKQTNKKFLSDPRQKTLKDMTSYVEPDVTYLW